MKKAKLKLLLTVFVPIFALYAYTASSTVYWQDSGIYLSGIRTLGIIYPPGYPLYLLLAWIWTKAFLVLMPWVTFAKAVHVLSGLFGAATSFIIALSILELLGWTSEIVARRNKKLKIPTIRINFLIAVSLGISSGLSYSLWSQSINAEVYSLAGLFSISIFYFVLKVIRNVQGKAHINRIYMLVFLLFIFWGLSFSNHPMAVLFTAPIFYLLFHLRLLPLQTYFKPGVWLRMILIFILFAVLFYVYLPIRSAAVPLFEWSKIDSLKSMIDHIIGKQYFIGESSLKFVDSEKIISFPRLFFEEHFITGSILFITGMYYLWKEGKYTRIIAKFAIVLGLIFYLVLNFYEQGTEYNYWLIPFYTFSSVVAGAGLWYLMLKIEKKTYLYIIAASLLVPQLFINLKYNNRNNYVLAQEFGKNILSPLSEGSIIFTLGDQDSAISSYLQVVEDYRTDITVIWSGNFNETWRIKKLENQYPDVGMPAVGDQKTLTIKQYKEFIKDFLDTNVQKRDVFLIQKGVIELPEGYSLVPAGTLWKVVKGEGEVDLSFWNYQFSDPDRYNHPERTEGSRKIKNNLGYTIGVERVKYSNEAKNFELQAFKNLAELCFMRYEDNKMLKVVNEVGVAETWFGGQLLFCARDYYEKMFEIDPDFYREDIWEARAQVYRLLGQEEKYKEIHNEVLIRSTNK